jgi:hypothetical protein
LRESYEWLNRTLGVYEPMQREFGESTVVGYRAAASETNSLQDVSIFPGLS